MPRKSTKQNVAPIVDEVSPDELEPAADDYAGAAEDVDEEPAYQGGQKRAKRAKNADPTKPKRPLNAFMLYSADKRAEMKHRGPMPGVTEAAKAIGEQWRQEDPEIKGRYQSKADELKTAYLAALAAA